MKDFWREVEATVNQVEQKGAVLVFDDTLQEKPYTYEYEVVCRHYDLSKIRLCRIGQRFNLLNNLSYVEDVSIPVTIELIKMMIEYWVLKTHKCKRANLITKNELMRELPQVGVHYLLIFPYAPVQWVVIQINHIFAVLYAPFKLECLRIKRRLNHFSLRALIYLKATCNTFDGLQVLNAAYHRL